MVPLVSRSMFVHLYRNSVAIFLFKLSFYDLNHQGKIGVWVVLKPNTLGCKNIEFYSWAKFIMKGVLSTRC